MKPPRPNCSSITDQPTSKVVTPRSSGPIRNSHNLPSTFPSLQLGWFYTMELKPDIQRKFNRKFTLNSKEHMHMKLGPTIRYKLHSKVIMAKLKDKKKSKKNQYCKNCTIYFRSQYNSNSFWNFTRYLLAKDS